MVRPPTVAAASTAVTHACRKDTHFGFLANRHRTEKLERARELLDIEPPEATDSSETWEERCQRLTGRDPTLCPECRQGRMICVEILRPQPEGIDSS